MDLIQLLLLWSLGVMCIAHPIAGLKDFKKHRDRLRLLQRVERRVAGQRHRKLHPTGNHGLLPEINRLAAKPECVSSLACPRSRSGEDVPCVRLHDLCDDVRNCPHAEDEDPVSCLFFKMTKHFVSVAVENAKDVAIHHRHEGKVLEDRHKWK